MRFFTRNSIYEVDGQTLTRIPISGTTLRRDGESIKIIGWLTPITVGAPAEFLLDIREDGISTYRSTSTVVSIERGTVHSETDQRTA